MKKSLLLLSIFLLPLSYVKASGPYVGVDLQQWDNLGKSAQAVVGWNFQERLGVSFPVFMELRGGKSIEDDGGLKVDSHYGAFLKVGFPFSDKIDFYALGGVARSKVAAEAGTFESSFTDTGLALGAGAQLNLIGGFSINGELNDYDGRSVLSIGIRRSF